MGALIFAIAILFSIALHELGHLATAKWFGIKVEQYFVGFGPKIWSTRRGETEYGVKALPFGGFVRIAGMNPYEEIPPEDRERVFQAKAPWKRAIVLAAGSFTHFVVGLGIIAGILAGVGSFDPNSPTTTVASVSAVMDRDDPASPATPAARAGFVEGDRIVRVDGVAVSTWDETVATIQDRAGERIPIEVERDGAVVTLDTRIAERRPDGRRVGFLGVRPRLATIEYGPVAAVGEATKRLGQGMWASLKAFGDLFSPSTIGRLIDQVQGEVPRSEADPATVVGIGRAAGGLARSGDFAGLAYLIAGVNIFIGVANLLPLPPLDGGHLAVLSYEKISGRRVDMRRLIPVAATVITILGSMFLLLLYLDVVRPLPQFGG